MRARGSCGVRGYTVVVMIKTRYGDPAKGYGDGEHFRCGLLREVYGSLLSLNGNEEDDQRRIHRLYRPLRFLI